MKIKLNKPFAASSAVDEFDVRQMKKALNRLGYYTPLPETGITGIPDKKIYEALSVFQKDQGLNPTGTAKPGDETVQRLSEKATEKTEGPYIWRTVGDEKVRASHAALEGEARDFEDFPAPQDEPGCRCWAEMVEVDAIKPVYPELILIPALKFGRILKIIREFYKHSKRKKYTSHGAQRSNQRNISQAEAQEAIKSAKENGNVTTKIGKYGTKQNHYKGSNGVTIVEETEGRNAGKIITMWRHK